MAQSTKDQNIASIWLFSECSAKEIRSISSVADAVSVPAGRTLVKEGTIGRELYLIVSGTAAVAAQRASQVATLGPGQHFGELSLLDRRPRNATVVSKTDMELFVHRPAPVQRPARHHPDAGSQAHRRHGGADARAGRQGGPLAVELAEALGTPRGPAQRPGHVAA